MSYTPINWQTGDVITAEKLNKMDNGWEVESTEIVSETVTTSEGQGGLNVATLDYQPVINAASINVTFDGTDYVCERIDFGTSCFYGGFSATTPGPDFSEYPFFISSGGDYNMLYTETAGTHTIAVSGDIAECGDKFAAAVQSVMKQTGALPLELVENTTMYEEAHDAFNSGRLLYFDRSLKRYFVTTVGWGDTGVTFIPDEDTFTAGFDYDTSKFYFVNTNQS